jgi:hypothetical protein
MFKFRRGLSPALVERLNEEYERGGWWKAMADDPQLFIAIRDEYLNVYWKGNSLVKLSMQDGHLHGNVHYKYMLRPETKTNPYLTLVDGKLQSANPSDFFLPDLSDIASLKRSANAYAGEEKAGIHKIVMSNANIIDVEVAFGTEISESGTNVAQRIDFAVLQLGEHGPELIFYEGKGFNNPELRSNGDNIPPVMNQLKSYQEFLRHAQSHQSDVTQSYQRVCDNLLSLCGVQNRFISIQNLLLETKRKLVINSDVRLVVFGYDRDQETGAIWQRHRQKLQDGLKQLSTGGSKLLLCKGDPKGFTNGISSPVR